MGHPGTPGPSESQAYWSLGPKSVPLDQGIAALLKRQTSLAVGAYRGDPTPQREQAVGSSPGWNERFLGQGKMVVMGSGGQFLGLRAEGSVGAFGEKVPEKSTGGAGRPAPLAILGKFSQIPSPSLEPSHGISKSLLSASDFHSVTLCHI